MRLYIVRHGQTSWNVEGKAQGHTDIPLDEVGQLQARQLGRAFKGVVAGRILCSDLLRAQDTAGPLAAGLGLKVELTNLLRERRFGDWEGRNYEEVGHFFRERELLEGVDRWEVRAPGGGESFHDLWNRLDPIVAELFDSHHSVVVVTHGGTAAALVARIVEGTLGSIRSFRFSNAGITELIRRNDGTFLLSRYNDTHHLIDDNEPDPSGLASCSN